MIYFQTLLWVIHYAAKQYIEMSGDRSFKPIYARENMTYILNVELLNWKALSPLKLDSPVKGTFFHLHILIVRR